MPSTVYLHHRLKAKGTLDYWAEPLTESKQPFSLYEWSQVCHHSEWKVTHQREQTGAGGRGGISHCPTLRRCSGVDTSSSLCLSNMHMWLNILLLRTFSTLVFYKNGSSDLLILEKKKGSPYVWAVIPLYNIKGSLYCSDFQKAKWSVGVWFPSVLLKVLTSKNKYLGK